jgi:aspartate/tyrosine/aromatic aminotransferase
MSFFEHVKQLPEDPIFHLPALFKADSRDFKVNLSVGAYQDDQGLPVVLNCIRKAEQIILSRQMSKNYLPIPGDAIFINLALELMFGEAFAGSAERIFGAQALGGTGALKIGAEFIASEISKTVYVSDPTWPNHYLVFARTGIEVKTYPYYSLETREFAYQEMMKALREIPDRSVVILQGSCHNPTGADPTMEQWKEITAVIKEKSHFPFFDCAYQGFGIGVDQDVEAMRHFLKEGIELMAAYSFSKNMGLYGERAGLFCVAAHSKEAAGRVGTHIKQIIRSTYSNPPLHGARLVETVLGSNDLKTEWLKELAEMRNRITFIRNALANGLMEKTGNRDFSFLKNQCGMFSYSGLTSAQVLELRSKFGIYMLENGRMSAAGLNTRNLDYVVDAIASLK